MYDALLAYSGGSQGVRDNIYWYIPYRRIFLDGATRQIRPRSKYPRATQSIRPASGYLGRGSRIGRTKRALKG